MDCNLSWSQKFCWSLASSVQTFQSNILIYRRVNFVYHHLTFPFSKFLKLSVYCKFSIGKNITLSNYTKIRVKKIQDKRSCISKINCYTYVIISLISPVSISFALLGVEYSQDWTRDWLRITTWTFTIFNYNFGRFFA